MTNDPPEWQINQPLTPEMKYPQIREWQEIDYDGDEEDLDPTVKDYLYGMVSREELEAGMSITLMIAGLIEAHMLHTYSVLIVWSVLYITNQSR